MKILNISRYLPIEGFPPNNDITLKIYAELKNKHAIESQFIMPLSHIPKWVTYLKKTLKNRYKVINNDNYIDKKYKIPIHFYQGYFGLFAKIGDYRLFKDIKQHFTFYRRDLYKKVNKINPDLVHAHTVEDAFYAYKIYLKFGIPYIITLRGFYHDIYQLELIKKVLHNAKKIVTPSARLKRDLEELYKVELLPHGLDSEWYLNKEKDFDNKTLRIITVASLIEMKNIQVILKSISNLIHEGYKVKYSIVGEGAYEDELKNMVKENNIEDYVTFHGFLSHEKIRELYYNNEVFIMLSYPETFGRVFFEAAAQGLLIIGRKNTGIDGYFKKDEAFITDGSVEETTSVLKKINEKVFRSMTDRSRKKIKDFENNQIIQRYYQIIQSSC